MQKAAFSIYDASAGSGKTYTLVKEYLKIILDSPKNDAYKNILAITFTNKAVHEMKSRVVESLSEFANENPNEKALRLMEDIGNDIKMPIEEIRIKSQTIIKNIIHNYASFDISTIDKFTHKVIRAFAFDLKLPITFDVSLDTENILTEAVDAIISKAGEDDLLTKLLIDFAMEKTDEDKSWDVSREIMETGKMILNENNRLEIAQFQDKSIEDFVNIKNKLSSICVDLKQDSISFAESALKLIESKGLEYSSFYSSFIPKHFLKLSKGEIVKHTSHYKYLEESEGKRYSAKTPMDKKEAVDSIADELLFKLKQINEIAEKYMFYNAFLKNITPLSLLNTVSNEIEKIQKDQNILSISEFNKLINEQIQNQPAPFIYERLGEKYRHFFIDEFQDTSEMQWQNLIPLIDNALSSEDMSGNRGSLMIVGDPKQSIYRWRGGKAEQFINLSKSENPFNNPDKKLFKLKTNYRSYSQVVEFNNSFFRNISVFFDNKDYEDLYLNHSFQECNDKKGGYVNISFIPEIDKEDSGEDENLEKSDLYLKSIFSTIKDVSEKGFSYKDIVVLTRKKTQGVLIANYLTENSIPILSSESLLLASSSEVQFIINVLKYLKSDKDSESKVKFLYYLSKELLDIKEIHDFVLEGKNHTEENKFYEWLKENNVDFSFHEIRKKSLYEAVELIMTKLIKIEKRNAYTQFFLDLVLEHDLKKQAGISDFLFYWENNSHKLSIPSPEGNDAVRIMTIHKSKGLEFPVVIFPFAEEDFNRGPKEKMWLNPDETNIDLPKVLIDKSSKVEEFGNEASDVYNDLKQKDLMDNINILYVALTRAEEQLYVISSLNISKKGDLPNNMSSFFIHFLQNERLFDENKMVYEFGNSTKVSKSIKVVDKTNLISKLSETLNFTKIKIAQKESVMWGTHQQKAIEYGNVIHEVMSMINTLDDIEMAINKSVEIGLIVKSEIDNIFKIVNDLVSHPELKSYFDGINRVLNEKTIILKNGKTIKPDRVVINDKDEASLLDYKTGTFLPKHKKQLEDYQLAIEDMGLKVTKKTLVYIGEAIEIVNL